MLSGVFSYHHISHDAHLKGYVAVKEMLPNLPQVFVFDTAFHQTMPAKAYMYAVPYKYYEENNIRRWGAHGTSHRFVTARVCEVLGVKPEDVRIITCHIGNGASVSAVKYGKCVDTSMGLTPLEGLMMGTRSGDVDPSAVLSIMKKEGLTPDQMSDLLNKQSGVKGISGVSSDIREVEAGIREGNERCQLAMDMYSYRIKKYVGAYAAVMGGVDIVVFTAGVGEHQWDVRQGAVEDLEFMGIQGRYIYWAAATIGIAIVGFIIAYCVAGFVLALIILSVTVTSGVGLILFKQRKGLHSKRQERGVFIYAYSKKM